tara:strand:- start:612 stop:851 length:240 start_codon:yes stop_codon:yes gene_type:complete
MHLKKLWKVLPMDLVNKIMLFAPIQPPHFLAYKTGIRIITLCELNCKLSGTIKLEGGGYEENELNEEWFLFLLSQEYNI